MRKPLFILAAATLPLAACAMSPYGYGYDNYGSYGSYGTYNPVYGSIGALGYGSNFRQAAASSCANYASRYGRASVRNVQTLDSSHVKVFGYVSRGYRSEGWDCTFRADGRITDFDL
jgi:hypothetical protein